MKVLKKVLNLIKTLKLKSSAKISGMKLRSNKVNGKYEYKWYNALGIKLMVSFLLPVCFVILIGYISYQKASDAIINKYKASSLQAIEMTQEYVNFGMESIIKTSLQYTIDPDIIKFVDNDFENGSDRRTYSTKINGRINQEKQWGKFLSDIHILSEGITLSTTGNVEKNLFSILSVAPEIEKEGEDVENQGIEDVENVEDVENIEDAENQGEEVNTSIINKDEGDTDTNLSSSTSELEEDAFEEDVSIEDTTSTEEIEQASTEVEVMDSADEIKSDAEEVTGEEPIAGSTEGTIYASLFDDYWTSKEAALDEKLNLDSDSYSVRYIKGLPGRNGAVVMDIGTSAIQEVLQRLDFGKGSIISFVTEDGTEIARSQEEAHTELIFTKSEFYQASLETGLSSGIIDAIYLDKKYLYLYAEIGETGNMICVLIPESTIVSQVSSIKKITYLLVVVASILAILIGTLISTNLQNVIKYIIFELKKVAGGNLKVNFATMRKDEFFVLTNGLNDTVVHMRGLITNVQKQSETVSESSTHVRKASEVFAVATSEIISSIHEIQQGIDQQARDSQDCLQLMDHLSEKIEDVSGKTNDINQIAQMTKNSILQGLSSVEVLNDKTNSTAQITDSIVTKIQIMEQMSSSIGMITATINSIADSTNLLSLNASIEAARAGAAGSGFKVVADEIRKLADQSLNSVKKIDHLISDMQKHTSEAVATAKTAEMIIKEQEIAFQHTKGSFYDMNRHAESLINNVSMILISIQTIEKARQAALSAIESISAVSQQTAAASIAVNETTQHQTEAVNALDTLSKELEENALLLHQVIDQFEL